MLIFVPILALLLIAWAPPPCAPPRLSRVFLPAVGVMVLWVMAIRFIPDRMLYPESRSTNVVEAALRRFRSRTEERIPIIILEGSSLTFYGIDGQRMAKALREKHGRECMVLQLSSPGANHYERLKMFKEFLSSLSPGEKDKLGNSRVVVLREVFREYDERPLKYLEGDDIYRNVFYTDLDIFARAWHACAFIPGSARLRWNLIRSTALHEFGVGAFSGFYWPEVNSPVEGYFPLYRDRPKDFQFDKAWQEFAGDYVKGNSIKLSGENQTFSAWKHAASDFFDLVASRVDQIGYFAPPVLSVRDYSYQKAFLKSIPPGTVVFGPAGPEVFQKLGASHFWFDSAHTSPKGSVVTTDWMIEQLSMQWNTLFPPQ